MFALQLREFFFVASDFFGRQRWDVQTGKPPEQSLSKFKEKTISASNFNVSFTITPSYWVFKVVAHCLLPQLRLTQVKNYVPIILRFIQIRCVVVVLLKLLLSGQVLSHEIAKIFRIGVVLWLGLANLISD